MVTIAAAVTVLAVAGDDGREAAEPTSSTLTDGATPAADATPAGETTPAADATGDFPPAPWRAAAVPRAAVPPAYVDAWARAGNRATCALLFPVDGGTAMEGAEPTEEDTPDDRGWNISLTAETGTVQVLGLFDQAAPVDSPAGPATFTRRWADGSVAKYGAEVGTAAPGTYDPDTSPFEAVLTLPDQSCAYRIYDSLGRAHLESVFDRLRLMAP